MKNQSINARSAITPDTGALNILMRESCAYSGRYRTILEGYEITPEQVTRDHFFIAEKTGTVLGFYALASSPEPELDLMFVSDRAQGMGLGRRLFDHMLAVAGELGFESVKIVSHPPSVGFYLRMGARQTGMQPPSGRVSWERPVLRIDTARRVFARTDDAGPANPL